MPVGNQKRQLVIAVSLLLLLIVILITFFQVPKWQRQLNYPLKYQNEILFYSKEFNLDPDLVAAVIYCESGYRADAVSSVGAIGLMQVMPDTGVWIAGKFDEPFGESMLRDPATNIRYGCWFLRYLFDRFGDDLTLVLAAYNAGGGNVAKWLQDEQYSPDGETLTHIPNKQPREYVVKVKKAHEGYQQTYHLREQAVPKVLVTSTP